jgi:hypothetical protein
MPDLVHKLGIKPGHRVCVLKPPPRALDLLIESTPPDVTFTDALGLAPYDIILFWPTSLDGLADLFTDLQRHIVANGAVWAVMPKKPHAAKRAITFTWEQMQRAVLQTDMVDNKIASFSDEDYATRFVIRRNKRH